MCTLLIIGLLQGLGIDPKNHGPLGFQNENEEDEEEPILHLVLDNEVVELDDLPVVVDDETEIIYQKEAVATFSTTRESIFSISISCSTFHIH